MIYKIPINWQLSAELEIEAASLEEAMKKADEMPLPEGPAEGAEYINDSFEIREELIPEINELGEQDKKFSDDRIAEIEGHE